MLKRVLGFSVILWFITFSSAKSTLSRFLAASPKFAFGSINSHILDKLERRHVRQLPCSSAAEGHPFPEIFPVLLAAPSTVCGSLLKLIIWMPRRIFPLVFTLFRGFLSSYHRLVGISNSSAIWLYLLDSVKKSMPLFHNSVNTGALAKRVTILPSQ